MQQFEINHLSSRSCKFVYIKESSRSSSTKEKKKKTSYKLQFCAIRSRSLFVILSLSPSFVRFSVRIKWKTRRVRCNLQKKSSDCSDDKKEYFHVKFILCMIKLCAVCGESAIISSSENRVCRVRTNSVFFWPFSSFVGVSTFCSLRCSLADIPGQTVVNRVSFYLIIYLLLCICSVRLEAGWDDSDDSRMNDSDESNFNCAIIFYDFKILPFFK